MDWNFGAGCAVAVALILSISSCDQHQREQKTERIKALANKGFDPLDIPCAADTGTERFCELRAATRGKQ